MPTYVYRVEDPKGSSCSFCADGFELIQKIADPLLTQCPNCASPVVQVITPPAIVGSGTHLLKEKNLGEKGFTQYRKIAKGHYEKTAGKGPDFISDDGK